MYPHVYECIETHMNIIRNALLPNGSILQPGGPHHACNCEKSKRNSQNEIKDQQKRLQHAVAVQQLKICLGQDPDLCCGARL